LRRDLRRFLKGFETSQGRRGIELVKWTDEQDKAGLLQMAKDYLVHCGNGNRFWPDNPKMPNYNELQWVNKKEFIYSVVIQVFFRMNYMRIRNPGRKHDRQQELPGHKVNTRPPLVRTGTSKDNPITIDVHASTGAEDSNSSQSDPFLALVDPALRCFASSDSNDIYESLGRGTSTIYGREFASSCDDRTFPSNGSTIEANNQFCVLRGVFASSRVPRTSLDAQEEAEQDEHCRIRG
ncbi:hypothetical protein S40288_11787, partial [Stachybotrys chartarum IBT 40288]